MCLGETFRMQKDTFWANTNEKKITQSKLCAETNTERNAWSIVMGRGLLGAASVVRGGNTVPAVASRVSGIRISLKGLAPPDRLKSN